MPPRFDVYRAVSAQICEIFSEHTDLIEPLSLDEAYLDVTENKQGITIATEITTIIRARIKEVTGPNASAGISNCKFLAKMASDVNKPNGQAVITPKHGPAFVEALAVKKFHGVDPATAARMEKLGIFTGGDLKEKPLAYLQEHFGKSGDGITTSPAASTIGPSSRTDRGARSGLRIRSWSTSPTERLLAPRSRRSPPRSGVVGRQKVSTGER